MVVVCWTCDSQLDPFSMRGLSYAIPTRLVYPVFRTQVSLTIQVRLFPTRSHIYPRDGSPSSPTIRFLAGPPFRCLPRFFVLDGPPLSLSLSAPPTRLPESPSLTLSLSVPLPSDFDTCQWRWVCVCVASVGTPTFVISHSIIWHGGCWWSSLDFCSVFFLFFHVFYFRISSPFSLFVLLGCRYNEV